MCNVKVTLLSDKFTLLTDNFTLLTDKFTLLTDKFILAGWSYQCAVAAEEQHVCPVHQH